MIKGRRSALFLRQKHPSSSLRQRGSLSRREDRLLPLLFRRHGNSVFTGQMNIPGPPLMDGARHCNWAPALRGRRGR
ncbi:hypothetical protein CDAR_598221 [Caerostris darwini]|uniref:Ycf15 n=1 Tax=Caerostris darwini TaxID=1538125 RepID=A0AAV4QHQ3_9ARAC|nr:hypothetical protein CDAR_598221 [Caerostris darwini]